MGFRIGLTRNLLTPAGDYDSVDVAAFAARGIVLTDTPVAVSTVRPT